MEFAAKARSAAMARRRMYGTVGEAIVDARLIRVVEHFHAVTEWRWSDKLAPVFACVDGQAVGVVMPMNGAPTDKDAEALEHAIAKTRTDLASVVAATQKAEEILSAKDKLEALRVAADAANRAFCEARDLAEKASLLDGAEAREAELHARLGSLQARLAAHNAVDVDTKEKA
jgi:ubiquinone biosynthesis protein UbiJ